MFQARRDGNCVHLTDSSAESSAKIVVSPGFNAYSFVCRLHGKNFDLLYSSPTFPSSTDRPTGNGTPILAPFPNRIRGGRYRYAGVDYSLPRNERDINAIHGFAVTWPWRLVDLGADPGIGAWARGEFQLSVDRPDCRPLWPADFRLAFTYTLNGSRLTTAIEVVNPSDHPLPFGLGTHPYFRFPLAPGGSPGDCEIFSPATTFVKLDACLPTGETRPVSGNDDLRNGLRLDQRGFDDVFTGLPTNADGQVEYRLLDHRAGVEFQLTHDASFPYTVIYVPPHKQAICIEPYTCITDAINLEGGPLATGLWTLAPGETRTATIAYVAKEIS